jgi:hypothetical protein
MIDFKEHSRVSRAKSEPETRTVEARGVVVELPSQPVALRTVARVKLDGRDIVANIAVSSHGRPPVGTRLDLEVTERISSGGWEYLNARIAPKNKK